MRRQPAACPLLVLPEMKGVAGVPTQLLAPLATNG
jgi:hypothetical protein